jgi:hypothetical protein
MKTANLGRQSTFLRNMLTICMDAKTLITGMAEKAKTLTAPPKRIKLSELVSKLSLRFKADEKSELQFNNLPTATAEIFRLETSLGLEHRPPFFNLVKANQFISQLNTLLVAKTELPEPIVALEPIASAVAEITAATAFPPVSQVAASKPESASLEKSVENTQAGFPSLTEGARMGLNAHIQAGRKMYSEIVPRVRAQVPAALVVAAPRIVSGETFLNMDAATRQNFFTDGGALSKSDFDKLTPRAKTNFCVNGGKLVD